MKCRAGAMLVKIGVYESYGNFSNFSQSLGSELTSL